MRRERFSQPSVVGMVIYALCGRIWGDAEFAQGVSCPVGGALSGFGRNAYAGGNGGGGVERNAQDGNGIDSREGSRNGLRLEPSRLRVPLCLLCQRAEWMRTESDEGGDRCASRACGASSREASGSHCFHGDRGALRKLRQHAMGGAPHECTGAGRVGNRCASHYIFDLRRRPGHQAFFR